MLTDFANLRPYPAELARRQCSFANAAAKSKYYNNKYLRGKFYGTEKYGDCKFF
jgi:hypothetical protein